MAETSDSSLNPNDYKCPICLDLLYEPVTLPCKHAMCFSCFHTNRDESNLHCPLCRTRYSVWARKLAKKGPRAFIDERRAEKIKRLFPELYERRVGGSDEQGNNHYDIWCSVLRHEGHRELYKQKIIALVRTSRFLQDLLLSPTVEVTTIPTNSTRSCTVNGMQALLVRGWLLSSDFSPTPAHRER